MYTSWYPVLRSMYNRGIIKEVVIYNSVTKGLITEEEGNAIINHIDLPNEGLETLKSTELQGE